MIRALHLLPPKWFAILSWVVVTFTPALTGLWLFGKYGFMLGLLCGLFILWMIAEYFFKLVPKKQAALVMNPILKTKGEARIRIVLSGWNFIYPWEQLKEDGCFPLDEIKIPLSESIPAKDVKIKVEGFSVIAPDPKRLLQYFVSGEIVLGVVGGEVKDFITQIISKQTGEEARSKQEETKKRTTNYFSKGENASDEEKDGSKIVSKIEKSNGIIFHKVVIEKIDFEDDYQKAKTTKARMEVLREAAQKMDIPLEQAWENVLVVGGEVKKSVLINRHGVDGTGKEGFLNTLFALADAIGGNKGEPPPRKPPREGR